MKRSLLVVFAVACGGNKPVQTIAPAPDPAPAPTAAPAVAVAPPPAAKPQGHHRTDLIPRSVLFGNPERASVQLSSNEKYLAWVAARDGVMNVFVAPRAHLDQAKPITADKTRPVSRYFWAFDNTHILVCASAYSGSGSDSCSSSTTRRSIFSSSAASAASSGTAAFSAICA